MGPSAIRYAGLEERLTSLGRDCADWGNVETAVAEATASGDPRARFLTEIRSTCERVARQVGDAVGEGRVPIVLGGDHSIALGTLGGLAAAAGGPGAALWIDGVRSLDDGERALVRELDLAVHTMSEVDRRGIEPLVADALQRAAGAAFFHVSLDMDALDPEVAPGVGTAVRGGLSYREAHLAMELVAESGLLGSFEIVEVNPILDRENATAALAVELAASAFGARIL